MGRFRVRLEDPNSDEFRVVFVTAPDEHAAKRKAEQLERRYVEHTIASPPDPPEVWDEKTEAWVPDPEWEWDGEGWIGDIDRLRDLEAKEKADELTRKEFGALHLHRQSEPYKVVSVRDRGESRADREAREGGDS